MGAQAPILYKEENDCEIVGVNTPTMYGTKFYLCFSGNMGAHTPTMYGMLRFDVSLFRCKGVQHTHVVRMKIVVLLLVYFSNKTIFAGIYSTLY